MTQKARSLLETIGKSLGLIVAVAGAATAGVNLGARMLESALLEPRIAPVHKLAADSFEKSTQALDEIKKLHERGTSSSRERLNIEEREVQSIKSEITDLKKDLQITKASSIRTETNVEWIREALERNRK